MNRRLNSPTNILIVPWMLYCIVLALFIYNEIPSAINASAGSYPFGMEGLGRGYATLQNYVITAVIQGTWFALGGIISILALKYPRYRIYVLFHFITLPTYVVIRNIL